MIRGAHTFHSAVVSTVEMTDPLTTSNDGDTEAVTGSTSAISATNLRFTHHSGTTAVQNMTLDIRKGEFFGFGPNGAGKTTLIKMLVTLLKPTTGHVTVNGFDAVEQPERADRIAEHLQFVELEDAADAQVDTFSGGMQKRLDITTSLVYRPPLVFFDEPTTGLDPNARLRLWAHLRDINAHGTTVFFTTQDLEEAGHLCNRLVMIAGGEPIARGSSAELKQQVGDDTLDLETTMPTDVERTRKTVIEPGHLGEDDHVGLTTDGLVISSTQTRQIGTKPFVALKERGFTVTQFKIRSPILDDVFLTLTGGTLDGLAVVLFRRATDNETILRVRGHQ